jgi:hypothetical protein
MRFSIFMAVTFITMDKSNINIMPKWPGHEADHSPTSAEVKKMEAYTSTAQYVFMTW